MTNDEIIIQARKRFEIASTADRDERDLAQKDGKFAINYENCQWPKEIQDLRKNQWPPRPCLVMNKIPEKIDQVDGDFRQTQPEVKIRPVDSFADPKVAEIIAGLVRNIEYNSTAKSVYSTSHTSSLTCGRGAWRIDIEDSEDDPFVRDIVINRIPDVFSVRWDPDAIKTTKSDAKYWFVERELVEDEYKKTYPDFPVENWYTDDANWHTENKVRIAEYWWKEESTKTAYRVNRGGTVITVWEVEDDDILIETKEVKHPKVMWCITNGHDILEGPFDNWPSKYIPIVLEIGKESYVDGKQKTRGMVRFAIEPQQMYNYHTTSEAEQIALAPKAPYLVTTKMIGNYQTEWNNANIQNRVYLPYDVDPDAPNLKPYREPPPMSSPATIQAKIAMEHDIMSAMGIYQASLGDQGQEKSGKAILARQRQGNTGSFAFTDNFEAAYTHSTKIIVDLIPYVYDTERMVRIMGEDLTQKLVPINAREEFGGMQNTPEELISHRPEITPYINDLSVGKYDIIISMGPGYASQREESLNMLLDLAHQIPDFGSLIMDVIARNLDVKGSDEVIKRARKMLIKTGVIDPEPGEEPPPKEPDPKLQLEFMEQQRKEFETFVNGILTIAKAEAEEVGTQLNEYKAQMETIKELMGNPQGGINGNNS